MSHAKKNFEKKGKAFNLVLSVYIVQHYLVCRSLKMQCESKDKSDNNTLFNVFPRRDVGHTPTNICLLLLAIVVNCLAAKVNSYLPINIYIHLSMYLYWWINWDGKQWTVWCHSRGFTFWWWLEKVIRGKDKTNINKLIMMDCAANIFTVMIHTFNQTPLIKLRSTFLRWHNPVSLTSGFVHYKHAAAIYFTVVIIDFHLMR